MIVVLSEITMTSRRTVPELPSEVWTIIFSHIPTKQLYPGCFLINRKTSAILLDDRGWKERCLRELEGLDGDLDEPPDLYCSWRSTYKGLPPFLNLAQFMHSAFNTIWTIYLYEINDCRQGVYVTKEIEVKVRRPASVQEFTEIVNNHELAFYYRGELNYWQLSPMDYSKIGYYDWERLQGNDERAFFSQSPRAKPNCSWYVEDDNDTIEEAGTVFIVLCCGCITSI